MWKLGNIASPLWPLVTHCYFNTLMSLVTANLMRCVCFLVAFEHSSSETVELDVFMCMTVAIALICLYVIVISHDNPKNPGSGSMMMIDSSCLPRDLISIDFS